MAFIPSRSHAERQDAPGKLRRNESAIRNHYIVVLNESVARKEIGKVAEGLARMHGGTVGYVYRNALRGFSVEMNEAQAVALSRNPQVAFVEEDAEVRGASTQTGAPWPLDRIDQRNLPPNGSYNYESDGTGVNAYIIDGGIRYTHQEFGGRASFAYDWAAGGTGADCNGHGTHVAALLGGNTYGVAKGVKLWSVRVLDCANGGTLARIISGVDWVAGNHVKPAVANLSFITIVSTSANGTMDIAVKNLIAAGVTTVVAAGNNTGDASLRTPARVAEAITVAATDQNDNRSPNSNFGSVVDLFAPGVDIVSAWASDDAATNIRSGTSSAAPLVAGLAARYLGARPGDAPDAVAQAIRNNATPNQVINPGTGTPNLLAYAANTISDNFNDNSRDATKWLTPANPNFTVVEQNGRLEITPGATATDYDGYHSATNVDLTDSRISVEAIYAPSLNTYGTHLVLGTPGNYLLLGANQGSLLAQWVVGGVTTQVSVPYNATQQRFWRMRHNRPSGTVNWEYSADGVTWTTFHSMLPPFAITDLQVHLIALKPSGIAPTDTAIFDNLWHEANPTPPVAIADDFNDNVINPAMWVSDPNTSDIIKEQNGQLEVVLPPNTAGNFNTGLTSPIDFRDKTAQVEVQPASQGGWLQTQFVLYLNDTNYYTIQTSNNAATADATVNGVLDRTVFSWDGTNRFWRYRHDADANSVNFETSADGTTWTTRKTVAVAPTMPLHAVVPVIGVAVWGTGNSTPGTASFDNFRVERYQPRFPQSDNFNDNVRDAKKWNVPATTDFTFSEQNGQLSITTGNSGHEGYTAVNTIDLTDARASIESLSAPLYAGTASYFELIDVSTGNMLLMGVAGGAFVMEQHTGGVVSRTLLTYNAAQHRFWRIRHNRTNDTINWESSADNISWTTHRTAPRPFPVTNLQTALIAGRNPGAPSVTIIFDNLRIERNEGGKAR